MFPILTPTPTAAPAAPLGSEAVGAAPPVDGAEALAGDGSGSERGSESTSFSAVLLALASIGSPLHAAPVPAPSAPAASAPVAFFETALALDTEALTLATEREGVSAEMPWMSSLEGAHGIARPEGGKESAEGEWLAFKVIEGEVVFGDAVDAEALDRLGVVRPMEENALADLLDATASDPAPFETMKPMDLEMALPAPAKVEPLQVAPIQVAPAPGAQEVQESPSLDPSMLNRLSREFVVRLQRVADRMLTEYGMEIDVVEGYRSQSRQEALFAQGRTAPGNVVTWTTNSLHTVGAAADVFVDGAPVTPEQAAVLARVASQEGLKTLYPYDSGHIQLDRPGRAGMTGPEGPLDRLPAAAAPGAEGTQQPGVARVAPVARVARPARPGGMASNPAAVPQQPGGEAHAPDANSIAALKSLGGALPDPSGEAVGDRPAGRAPESAAPPGGEAKPMTAAGQPSAPLVSTTLPDATAVYGDLRTSPVTPASPLDLSAFDLVGRGSEYRRLHLPIEGVSGASLDIGVRPGSVDAFLNVSDPQLADQLRRSLHELRQVLTDRGIEARGLGVRLVAEGAGEMVQAAVEGIARGGSSEGSSGQSTTHGDRERGARYRDTTEEQDLPRQRREPSEKENN